MPALGRHFSSFFTQNSTSLMGQRVQMQQFIPSIDLTSVISEACYYGLPENARLENAILHSPALHFSPSFSTLAFSGPAFSAPPLLHVFYHHHFHYHHYFRCKNTCGQSLMKCPFWKHRWQRYVLGGFLAPRKRLDWFVSESSVKASSSSWFWTSLMMSAPRS